MPARISLGQFPTPLERLDAVRQPGCDVWVKRDDKSGEPYGGNKVRKLEYLLGDARARRKSRILTLGAVGSHHVLATAIYGRREGFEVDAVLLPQPRTEHVARNLQADLAQGLHAHAASSYASVPLHLAAELRADTYFISVGGSSPVGTLGYVAGARELAAQVRAGEMPEPDVIVVTSGSGGTAAGLAAGLAMENMRARVIAVSVADPPGVIAWYTRWLADRCHPGASGRLTFDARYLGKGYGHATDAGAVATEIARGAGIELDPTYTAKTFAAVLDLVEARQYETILYWHTLSSAPMDPLVRGAPEIDPDLARLFR